MAPEPYLVSPFLNALARLAPLLLLPLWGASALAAEFSVTPIRAEFKPGVLSETITVANEAATPLRVTVKLMEWTQDAAGQDVYTESADLVYFPRSLDIPPGSRRLVRVGAKTLAGTVERSYRLFIEEVPERTGTEGRAQVAFHFRFGVPIFVTPAVAKPQPEVMEPTLDRGKLSLAVRNGGNLHFRVTRLTVSDDASYSQDIAGWYSLAGSQRTYSALVPPDVCRRAKVLRVTIEGDGSPPLERQLHVDPARCA